MGTKEAHLSCQRETPRQKRLTNTHGSSMTRQLVYWMSKPLAKEISTLAMPAASKREPLLGALKGINNIQSPFQCSLNRAASNRVPSQSAKHWKDLTMACHRVSGIWCMTFAIRSQIRSLREACEQRQCMLAVCYTCTVKPAKGKCMLAVCYRCHQVGLSRRHPGAATECRPALRE
jgi:hypothetical protein